MKQHNRALRIERSALFDHFGLAGFPGRWRRGMCQCSAGRGPLVLFDRNLAPPCGAQQPTGPVTVWVGI